MSGGEVVRYTALDGVEVALDARTVCEYLVGGDVTLDDKDASYIIGVCRSRGLNPMAGDCSVWVQSGRPIINISKDYWVRTARKLGASWRAGVAVARATDGDGGVELAYRDGCIVGAHEKLVGGWAEVAVPGCDVPFRYEASFTEYDTGKSLWATKPATMIRKVALVSALREAMPAEFGGGYDAAEFDGAPEELMTDGMD